ncbi:MAG: carbamoyltransferase HypF [Candidatus Thermoplasmatota archaeon]
MKKIFVYGIVQGVGFRPMVYRVAKSMDCNGYVRNNGSNVEICIDKNEKEFIKRIYKELPPLAKIEKIIIKEEDAQINGFRILESKFGSKEACYPPDTATCNDCLKELFFLKNRRYLYPFINCTNCGARFSLIEALPYDRKRTSMKEFEMCNLCLAEYKDERNRRFHAQTISCKSDGPKYELYDKNGKLVKTDDPIKEFAKFIDMGKIGVLKGWGGMHIMCSTSQIKKLRRWYKRKAKPFAIMVRDIKALRKYAFFSSKEKKILESIQRPIVLLRKKKLEDASPGLGNIGIYLPYSAVHHILFSYMKTDAIVMTSCNPSGEPMFIENKDVFSLGLELYLLHNRKIVNRIDDTVLATYKNHKFFIRKSRGYVPEQIRVKYKESILGVGAEKNITTSLSKNNYLYTSPYIGNANSYNVYLHLSSSTKNMMKILGIKKLDGIGIDLHPNYPTRKFGIEMQKEFSGKIFEIQHHWAHACSLMVDNNFEEKISCLTFDGAGYGVDGNVWGGEILLCDFNSFKRIGHLEEFPLIGGDAAVIHPDRIFFALAELAGVETKIYDDDTLEKMRKLMKNSPKTTSFGRLLDALSALFGICNIRTYEGEPAMKTEPYLCKGKRKYEFNIEVMRKNGKKVISFIPAFGELVKLSSSKDNANLLYSFISCLIEKCIEIAAEEKINHIGFSGGVSYNIPIVKMFENFAKKNSLRIMLHNRVANGDGGIAVGQNAIVAALLHG